MPSLRRCTLAMLTAVGFAMALLSPAHATLTPPWSNASTNTAINSDFDTGTLTFSGLFGRSLTIVGPVDGYYHDHDNGCSSTIEVHVNGSWVLARTGPVSNDADQLLSGFGTINFPSGLVDGVRLGTTCPVDQAYHSIDPGMRFDIVGSGSVIPTLSETGLLALASLMLAGGVLALRRRRGR